MLAGGLARLPMLGGRDAEEAGQQRVLRLFCAVAHSGTTDASGISPQAHSLTSSHCLAATAACLPCRWVWELRQNVQNPNLIIALVGNKVDLADEARQVPEADARTYAGVCSGCIMALGAAWSVRWPEGGFNVAAFGAGGLALPAHPADLTVCCPCCLSACLPTCLPANLPARQPACPPTCLPACSRDWSGVL